MPRVPNPRLAAALRAPLAPPALPPAPSAQPAPTARQPCPSAWPVAPVSAAPMQAAAMPPGVVMSCLQQSSPARFWTEDAACFAASASVQVSRPTWLPAPPPVPSVSLVSMAVRCFDSQVLHCNLLTPTATCGKHALNVSGSQSLPGSQATNILCGIGLQVPCPPCPVPTTLPARAAQVGLQA